MQASERGFDTAEYDARTARAQERMAARGRTGLLPMTEPEVGYFANFVGRTSGWGQTMRPMSWAVRGRGAIRKSGAQPRAQLTEQPSHAAFDSTKLLEGMVLTLEPSLSYGDGLMMVHEENIVVQAGGANLLTIRAPAELPVIGA